MPSTRRELDKWLRHRLRAVQLRHWKRGTTVFREMRHLGASEEEARQTAAHVRSWWSTSARRLNRVMPIAYFDRLGVPKFS